MKARSYPGKLLLFGEYTTLLGSAALAMPLAGFAGHWTPGSFDPRSPLHAFSRYLRQREWPLPLNAAGFERALRKGLEFASNIPVGYGLGSSGALCAAVWDRFGQPTEDLPLLRQILAQMESFFHGSSSGSDPLVSFLERPILFRDQTDLQLLSFSKPTRAILPHIYLLDTGRPRQTAPLVERFLDLHAREGCREQFEARLLPPAEKAIQAFLAGASAEMMQAVRSLSRAQRALLPDMIPEALRPCWEKGLASGQYAMKLCGAGGGGFMLVFFHADASIERHRLNGFPLHPVC